MDDLKLYHSLHNKIAELESEIVKLETTIRTLRVSRSKYKKLYRDICNLSKPPTRTELVTTVLHEVKKGNVHMTHKEIAKKFHVSLNYVRELSSNVNKALING